MIECESKYVQARMHPTRPLHMHENKEYGGSTCDGEDFIADKGSCFVLVEGTCVTSPCPEFFDQGNILRGRHFLNYTLTTYILTIH